MALSLSGFRSQHTTVSGGTQSRTGDSDLHDGVRGDAALVLGAFPVVVEDCAAPDQMRTDGGGIDWRPLHPARRRDAGAVLGVANRGARAVETDRSHQRSAEPGRGT